MLRGLNNVNSRNQTSHDVRLDAVAALDLYFCMIDILEFSYDSILLSRDITALTHQSPHICIRKEFANRPSLNISLLLLFFISQHFDLKAL